MAPMIAVRSLRKRFGVIDAVSDISFSVEKGEVLGFLGPNGAGKTTTMKIVTGFLPATAGTVEICGLDMERDALKARLRLGYLPEGAPLYGDMTPLALFRFVAALRHMPRALRANRIDAVIDALELRPVLLRNIETLSKGFKRRVGLAQAVLHDPDVLILDEPTDGLDPNQKHHVRNLIRNMGGDKAIIISTHLLEEVDAVCDRAIIIDQGRIVLEGTPAQLHASATDARAVFVLVRDRDASKAKLVLDALPETDRVDIEHRADQTSRLRVGGPAGPSLLATIANKLGAVGIELLELQSQQGSLDAVFRRVTGSQSEKAAQIS